ncbi:ComEC/Rec2 family competence protein [Chitinophaga skermanii]|nr:ComEC/Rec2 family competence protein [Chitinophaga skermanii]
MLWCFFFIALLVICGFVVFRFIPLRWRFVGYGFWGYGLILVLMSVGCWMSYGEDIRLKPQYYGHFQATAYILDIAEPPIERKHVFRAIANIKSILVNNNWIPATGKVMVFCRKDSLPNQLNHGDRIIITKSLQPIAASGNPGNFDYQAYAARQQLFHQVFLQRNELRILKSNTHSRLDYWLMRTRAKCLQIMKTYIPDPLAVGVAEALLIGYRFELDDQIIQTYTNTGVIHIIAISGLHLGLLYISLVGLLKYLPNGRCFDWARACMLIGLLWLFSLLTGASASVLRSAVMFTCMAVGQYVLRRPANIYNTLAGSAMLLLWYRPSLLLDVGFQLSYLAVIGIVVGSKKLVGVWIPPYKWMMIIWQMLAVTLSAQVFTTPICLYYFHQFPNYFLLANLLAVPISTVILYAEIVLLFCSSWGVVASFIGKVIGWAIACMNAIIAWISDLPGALWIGIHVSAVQTALSYLVIVLIVAVLLLQWRRGWWLVGLTVWGMVCRHVWEQYQFNHQRKLIIYNLKGTAALDCIVGRTAYYWQDTTNHKREVMASRDYFRVEKLLALGRVGNIACMKGMRIAWIDHDFKPFQVKKKLQVDYIVLTGNPRISIQEIISIYTCKMIIFDASNNLRHVQGWKNDCNKLPLRCISVLSEGALVVNF